jgi:hypothetical protein
MISLVDSPFELERIKAEQLEIDGSTIQYPGWSKLRKRPWIRASLLTSLGWRVHQAAVCLVLFPTNIQPALSSI